MATKRIASLVTAALLLAAGCGQSDEEASGRVDQAPASTVPTTAGPPYEAPADQSAEATERAVELGTTLSSVLDNEPGPHGWSLPAGRWTSDAFEPPLTFETTAETILRSESKDHVVLLDPMSADDKTMLTIARVGSVPSPTGEVPPARSPDDLRQSILDHPSAELADETSPGTVANGTTVTAFDIIVSGAEPDHASPCWIGFECMVIATTTAGESVFTLNDSRARIYFTGLSEGRLRAYVSGGDGGHDSMSVLADEIVTSLEVGGGQPEPSSIQSLGVLGSRLAGLPIGEYQTMLGSTLATLTIEEDLPGLPITFSGEEMLIFQPGGSTFLVLFEPRLLVTAAADQDRLFRDEERPGDLIDPTPSSSDEFEAWLESVFNVTTTSSLEVAGSTVPLWEVELDDSVVARNCSEADSEAERCVKLGFSDGTFHWQTSEEASDLSGGGGWFFLPEFGIAGYGGAGDSPTGFIETFQPILDRLTFDRPQ